MSLSLADKASRSVRLLFGMRNPVIAQALARYGFTDAVIQEGWRVLRDASPARSAPMGRPTNVSSATLSLLEAWQGEWFAVVELALEAKHPELAPLVFADLERVTGPECALHVARFVQRISAMEAGEAPFGEAGKAARASLEARGFRKVVLDEAKALLAELEQVAPEPAPALDAAAAAEQAAAAEAALTAWYREWSGIARIAVESRGLLRQLGLVASHASGGSGGANADGAKEEVGHEGAGSDAEHAVSVAAAGATNGATAPARA